MCGIAGSFTLDSRSPASRPELVQRMIDQLHHRGPDDSGVCSEGAATLGHTRLSIIDLSERGRQPLRNEDGTLVAVFNGEIYNHRELRAALRTRGHEFRGGTDGEVIVHLYEELGPDCVRCLDGMFAFALYDVRARTLLLARDRIGEKPLYYTEIGGTLFFASELRCLWTLETVRPTLSDAAVMNYFVHTQAPAPDSMIAGVLRLPPAHRLVAESGKPLTPRPYWHVDYTRKRRQPLRANAAALRDVLGEVVEQCAVSDVDVGLTLSGGVDSSTILGLMGHRARGMATFTLGRAASGGPDPEFVRAGAMAARYGTAHSVYPFEQYDFDDFAAALRHFDEPVGIYDIVYNLYFLRAVRESVKVVLTGNGADELFGGYRSYSRFAKSTALYQWSLSKLSPPARRESLDDWLIRGLNARNHVNASGIFSERLASEARAYDASAYMTVYRPLATYDTVVDARLFLDLMVGLNHSASLGDTTGMTWALESRSPFLHRRVVELAASLPTHQKVPILGTHRSTKRILKRLASGFMPTGLAFAEKFGCGHFINPFDLMRTRWRPDVERLLLDLPTAATDWFSAEKVMVLWHQFLRQAVSLDQRRQLLKLVIFLIWYRETVVRIAHTPGRAQVSMGA